MFARRARRPAQPTAAVSADPVELYRRVLDDLVQRDGSLVGGVVSVCGAGRHRVDFDVQKVTLHRLETCPTNAQAIFKLT